MTSQYSIVYISPNPGIYEKIALGLILFGNGKVYCRFSNYRLQIAKKFFDIDSYKMIADSVKSMTNKLNYDNDIYSIKIDQNLNFDEVNENSISKYIDYLSRYKNNLLLYSEPTSINLESNNNSFNKLYEKILSEINDVTESHKLHAESPIDIVKEKYGLAVNNHFALNRVIDSKKFKDLIVPVKVDLAGKNEIDVYVQSINMHTSANTIIQEIATFHMLKSIYKKNGVSMKDFVLTAEPPKDLIKQHELWSNIYKSNDFNYIDISEAQKIMDYAESHNVTPLLPDEIVI
jgi:hypothetical protein